MPTSKNALIRYKTIDKCLRNPYRLWTLEDLIRECSDALSEYEGREENVSRRTVQADIQMMRSDKLGYNAPIVVRDRKYYAYEDPDYSIVDVPLSDSDVQKMRDAVSVLRQLSAFTAFDGLQDIIGRLEDHVGTVSHAAIPAIYFERNDSLTGLHFITPLYGAIRSQRPVMMSYRSFNNRRRLPTTFPFSCYLLREWRNRWFIFGRKPGVPYVMNLALDRIESLGEAPAGEPFIPRGDFDGESYFKDMVGVTRNPGDEPQVVHFRVSGPQVPYVKTKPIHSSQVMVGKDSGQKGSVDFEIRVIVNHELEKELLGFGEYLTVLSPRPLRESLSRRVAASCALYSSPEEGALDAPSTLSR